MLQATKSCGRVGQDEQGPRGEVGVGRRPIETLERCSSTEKQALFTEAHSLLTRHVTLGMDGRG